MLERMEGTVIEEVEWKPLYGGAQGRESVNEEAEWRSLYGGAPGEEV